VCARYTIRKKTLREGACVSAPQRSATISRSTVVLTYLLVFGANACGGSHSLEPSTGDAAAGGARGSDGGLDGVSVSGDASATLPTGGCVPGAFRFDGGGCTCQPDTPTVCAEMCTDVTLDPANCGACGHACPETSTCNGGQCGPSVTNVVPGHAMCAGLALAVASGTLYWTDQALGTVMTETVTGGPARTIASAESAPGLIAVRGSMLFWVDASASPSVVNMLPQTSTTSTLRAMGLVSGVANDLVAETNLTGGIRGLALSDDGQVVYYSAGTKVRMIPAMGGAAMDVANEEPDGIPTALAVAGSTIGYVTDLAGAVDVIDVVNGVVAICGPGNPTTGDLSSNVNCTRVGRGQGEPFFGGLVIKDDEIYWSNFGRIQVTPAAQDPSGIHLDATQVAATYGSQIGGLVGDPNNIYVTDTTDGLIERTPYVINSRAIQIARGQMMPSAMAVDGTRVYWSTGDCAINATGL
jgi:stigma-specific protein Stig1